VTYGWKPMKGISSQPRIAATLKDKKTGLTSHQAVLDSACWISSYASSASRCRLGSACELPSLVSCVRMVSAKTNYTRYPAVVQLPDAPGFGWRWADSNPRPPACKAGALPLSYIPRSEPLDEQLDLVSVPRGAQSLHTSDPTR
jgi:hypothetical protein